MAVARTITVLSGLVLATTGLLLGPLPVHAEPPASALDTLLAGDTLARADNPSAANFFIEQGRGVLSAADEERALDQLRLSLRRQTSFMGRMTDSAFGAMSGGPAMQKIMEQQKQQSTVKSMLGGLAGIYAPPAVSQRQVDQAQQEMRQALGAPWIRGVEAARALEQLGEAQAAGRFYLGCLQMDPADWFAEVCLDGILQMGPARAFTLLNYMVDKADDAAIGNSMAALQGKAADGDQPALGVVPVRSAGLRGLGRLAGGGQLQPDQREQALTRLLQYADGKAYAPYFSAAAAGLGHSGDARAVEPLRRLAKYRKEPRVAEEAVRALAVGLKDTDAIGRLRDYLDDDDPETRMRALRSLLRTDDERSFAWAVDQVTATRAAESTDLDQRPRIVRELAENGSPRAGDALRRILAREAGNDWLQAWVAVALLENGDDAQLPAVSAALGKSDWTLDRAGLGALWGKISPLLNLAISATMGQLDPVHAVQTIGNMIAQERSNMLKKANDRELVSLQLRWQAADALAKSRDPAAVAQLGLLLDDPQPSVRMSAARALAVSPSPAAYDLVPKAMAADFGAEGGEDRSPQIRAALLRTALGRYPQDPRTRALCQASAGDPDPGVRFIALLGMKKT